jgi:hypothetical protein
MKTTSIALLAWITWGVFWAFIFGLRQNNAPQDAVERFLTLHFVSGINLLLLGKGVARILPVVQEPGNQDQRPQLDRGLPSLVWLGLKGIAFLGLMVMLFQTKPHHLLPTAIGIGAFVAVPLVMGVAAAVREQRE